MGERPIYDNATAQQDALERGLSPQANAIFEIAFTLFQVVVYYLLTALIAWRTNTGFGWFTTFILLLFSVASMEVIVGIARPFPHANLLAEIPGYLIWPIWLGWLYLFPNGQSVPRRTLWLMVLLLSAFSLLQIISLLEVTGVLPIRIETAVASGLGPIVALPLFGFILYSQIYRYRQVSNLIERQQTKWFLLGLSLFVLGIASFALLPGPVKNSILFQNVFDLVFLTFPLAVAVAMLRYRLFEVDIIIRRTLQYSVLTGLLVLVYYGSIVLLQNLFFGDQQSEIAIVLSTLLIAALFNPLRRRIQDVIDRRFYRKKYNAQQVLAQFAQTARDEVELDALTAELVRVVQETLQPDGIGLWLKPTGKTSAQITTQQEQDLVS